MDVFALRDRLIQDYAAYVGGFIEIRDDLIQRFVEDRFAAAELWPEPLIQLNPALDLGEPYVLTTPPRKSAANRPSPPAPLPIICTHGEGS
jgi:hypothetical protein